VSNSPRFDLTTFTGVTLAYRTVLMGNPLKALKICGDSFAFLSPEDDLYYCGTGPDGFPQLDKAKPFERSGWDEEFESWAGDASSAFTIASSVYRPTLVDKYDLTIYRGVIDAYQALLGQREDRGLVIGDAIVFIEFGSLVICERLPDGTPDMESVCQPDESAWDDRRDCWDCDSGQAETRRHIENPVFIDLPQ